MSHSHEVLKPFKQTVVCLPGWFQMMSDLIAFQDAYQYSKILHASFGLYGSLYLRFVLCWELGCTRRIL